jgi:hypothetical protein
MKTWVPLALAGVVVLAYAVFTLTGSPEGQGGSSLGIVNTIGLATVLVGIAAAIVIMRRFSVPQ